MLAGRPLVQTAGRTAPGRIGCERSTVFQPDAHRGQLCAPTSASWKTPAGWLRACGPGFSSPSSPGCKDGGEKALLGREGWLFYKPGCRYLTDARRRPRLAGHERSVGGHRGVSRPARRARHPAARRAGAEQGEHLSGPADAAGRASAEVLVARDARRCWLGLAAASVECVDLFEAFRAGASEPDEPAISAPLSRAGQPLVAGGRGAGRPGGRATAPGAGLGASPGSAYETATRARVRGWATWCACCRSPLIERRAHPENMPCVQVVRRDTGQPYQDDPDSEILVLGDSFLRIYEQDEPGAAGFIAHLAKELQQPLTSLVNDGGASTLVRQELASASGAPAAQAGGDLGIRRARPPLRDRGLAARAAAAAGCVHDFHQTLNTEHRTPNTEP